MATITVNGETYTLHNTNTTIKDLVQELNLEPDHVVVECNNNVYKGNNTTYLIKENDPLEIVHFVGGGQE